MPFCSKIPAIGIILPILLIAEFFQYLKGDSIIIINRQQLTAKHPNFLFLSIGVALPDTLLHPGDPQFFKLLTVFLTGCQF
jgi:hypothetical protein